MSAPAAKAALAKFRTFAYSVSPEFGAGADRLILQGQGLGEYMGDGETTDDLSTALDNLQSGLSALATATQTSVTNYLNAQTLVRQAVLANQAGLTTDQAGQLIAQGALTKYQTNNPLTANVGGVPLWAIFGLGAVGLVLISEGGKGRRR
jgi:hypothetical protein